MNAITQRILDRARDPLWVRQAVADARKLTGGPNACAATLSQFLIDAGVIQAARTWTADLVGTETRLGQLEHLQPMVRILHPADLKAGDIGVSRDRPDDGNDAPDHVLLLAGDPEGPDSNNPFALVVDNYCRNGKPYWRNLGKSGLYPLIGGLWRAKTPLAYGLRFVDPIEQNHGVRRHRQLLVNGLKEVYREAELAALSQPTLHHLNALRYSVELRDYQVE